MFPVILGIVLNHLLFPDSQFNFCRYILFTILPLEGVAILMQLNNFIHTVLLPVPFTYISILLMIRCTLNDEHTTGEQLFLLMPTDALPPAYCDRCFGR